MTTRKTDKNDVPFHPDDVKADGFNKPIEVYEGKCEATPRTRFISAIVQASRDQVFPDMVKAMIRAAPDQAMGLVEEGVPTPMVADIKVAEVDSDTFANVHMVRVWVEIPMSKEQDAEELKQHVDLALKSRMTMIIL